MNTAFLSDADLSAVRSIMASHGLSRFDAFVRIWGRGKAMDVRGTLGSRELDCLQAIARFLGNKAVEAADAISTAADIRLPSAAQPVSRVEFEF
jgi:hypothetical protein